METEHGEGRLRTLEDVHAYSMEQPYACTLHGATAQLAARVKLVGVLCACTYTCLVTV